MRVVAIDTETCPIGPDAIHPPLVCATIAEDGERPELIAHCDPGAEARLAELLTPGNGILIVGHNFGAFDLPVLCKEFPALRPLIWEKLARREITDTMFREQLLNLSTSGRLEVLELPSGGTKQIAYDLATLAADYLNEDISHLKEGPDTWRMKFDTLRKVPSSQYPADARSYALGDATITLRIYWAQFGREGSFETEGFQTASAFALSLITARGMPTDAAAFHILNDKLAAELSDERMRPLIDAGVLRPSEPSRPHKRQDAKARELVSGWLDILPEDVDWRRLDDGFQTALVDSGIKLTKPEPSSVNVGLLRELVEGLSIKAGRDVKRTPSGEVSTDAEVISDLSDDPVIKEFQGRQELQKLVNTELPRMCWPPDSGIPAPVVHFPFKALVETSRTSSHASNKYPSANGQNVDPRARHVYIPRPGFLLCSCDYSTLELACVAQQTYKLFGYSVHRDRINAGYDLHAYLGAGFASKLSKELRGISYKEFLSLEQSNQPLYDQWRTFAKPFGLGFPGGLGPYTIIKTAKKQYGVDIVAEAVRMFETQPEVFDRHSTSVLYYAKKLYGWGEDDQHWTPLLKGIALARAFRETWLDTYPEMRDYFRELQRESRAAVDADEDGIGWLKYTTPLGMVRAGCSYTSRANGQLMQSPAAEGFKTTIFNVVRATDEGSLKGLVYIVDEIHDELLGEVREDVAHDAAMELKRLMEVGMATILADVKVKTKPCLMRRWYKEAKQVFDGDGKLIPWEPKE